MERITGSRTEALPRMEASQDTGIRQPEHNKVPLDVSEFSEVDLPEILPGTSFKDALQTFNKHLTDKHQLTADHLEKLSQKASDLHKAQNEGILNIIANKLSKLFPFLFQERIENRNAYNALLETIKKRMETLKQQAAEAKTPLPGMATKESVMPARELTAHKFQATEEEINDALDNISVNDLDGSLVDDLPETGHLTPEEEKFLEDELAKLSPTKVEKAPLESKKPKKRIKAEVEILKDEHRIESGINGEIRKANEHDRELHNQKVKSETKKKRVKEKTLKNQTHQTFEAKLSDFTSRYAKLREAIEDIKKDVDRGQYLPQQLQEKIMKAKKELLQLTKEIGDEMDAQGEKKNVAGILSLTKLVEAQGRMGDELVSAFESMKKK